MKAASKIAIINAARRKKVEKKYRDIGSKVILNNRLAFNVEDIEIGETFNELRNKSGSSKLSRAELQRLRKKRNDEKARLKAKNKKKKRVNVMSIYH